MTTLRAIEEGRFARFEKPIILKLVCFLGSNFTDLFTRAGK